MFKQPVKLLFKQSSLARGALSMEEVVNLFSIDAHFELPSYSQDKRRVERCTQNLSGEFVKHSRQSFASVTLET
jgi:hypothetical protein